MLHSVKQVTCHHKFFWCLYLTYNHTYPYKFTHYADRFLNITNKYLVVDYIFIFFVIVKMLILFVGYIAPRILAVHFLL